MEYTEAVMTLADCYDLLVGGEVRSSRVLMAPVAAALNAELVAATNSASRLQPSYRRLHLTLDDYLDVLHPQGFHRTSLSDVTVVGWNKYLNDERDRRTIIGQLVRAGKQYGQQDHPPSTRAIKALSVLLSVVLVKASDPATEYLVVAVPSSQDSLNMLPSQISKLAVSACRNGFTNPPDDSVVRVRDIGQIKRIQGAELRLEAIKGAMLADPTTFANRRVWVVDDSLDSGSTLREIARALRTAGAIDVRAVALAKTRRFARETMNTR